MTVLLIGYDLNGQERPSAYAAVKQMIESTAKSWSRSLYSQWFVATDDSAATWNQRMSEETDDDDNWFICTISGPYLGWLPEPVVDWLSEHA